MIPVKIAGIEVAQFAAREFQVQVDSSKRVVLLTALEGSPTADALRRLGLPRLRVVRTVEQLTASVDDCDVLVVDRRVTSLWPESARLRPLLEDMTRQRKHVVFLAQDDVAWNANPLWDQVALARDASLAANVEVERDSLHGAMRTPNVLSGSDFDNWIFARGYNVVGTKSSPGLEIPLCSSEKKRPLVVTAAVHGGRMTYVDLALGPQWMSIHPGSLKILANLLSL
jgi:hypothetical protein